MTSKMTSKMGRGLLVLACVVPMIVSCSVTSRIIKRSKTVDESTQPASGQSKTQVKSASASIDDTKSTTKLNTLWTVKVGGVQGRAITLQPGIGDALVYLASADGDVSAFDVVSGEIKWRKSIEQSLSAGVGVGGDLVYVANVDGEVVALDGANGDLKWRHSMFSEVLATPEYAAGVVVVRSVDGKVLGLDASNGERIWGYQREVPSLSLRGARQPLVASGVAVAGFANGRLVASEIDDGDILWELPVAEARGRNEIERLIDIQAKPVLLGTVLYVAVYRGDLTALALGTRRVLWRQDVSSHKQIAVDKNHVYLTDDENSVRAFDRLTGEPAWVQESLNASMLTGPRLFSDELMVADGEGKLFLLDAVTGNLLDTASVKDGVTDGAMVVADRAYVLDQSGQLSVFSIGDG